MSKKQNKKHRARIKRRRRAARELKTAGEKLQSPDQPIRFWEDRDHEPPDPPPGFDWYFLRNRETGMVKLGLCRKPSTP